MNTTLRFYFLSALVCLTTSCGPRGSIEDAPQTRTPQPSKGAVSLLDTKVETGKETSTLPKETALIKKCIKNDQNKSFSLEVGSSSSESKITFYVEIPYFITRTKKYTCQQALGNENATKITAANTYDECMVRAMIPSPDHEPLAPDFSVYDMHRAKDEVAAFTYDGICTVDITKVNASEIEGKVDCTRMVRTYIFKPQQQKAVPTEIRTSGKSLLDLKFTFTCLL